MKAKLKQIIPWVLYDFANAPFAVIILTFVFSTFFTQHIANDSLIGTSFWSAMLALSGIVIGMISPIVGAIADQTGRKKIWLLFFASIVVISTFALSFVETNHYWFFLSLSLVFLANCCYSFAQVFYNSLLLTVSPSSMIGRISGLGWGLGYFGGLICLILTLLFFIPQNENIELLKFGIQKTLLLVAFWFVIFSAPIFILLKEKNGDPLSKEKIFAGIKQLKETIYSIKNYQTLTGFLIAYFFYSDGIATLLNFGGIFAATILGFSFHQVICFAIAINLIAGLGAIFFGLLDDKIGPAKLIVYSLIILIVCCGLIIFFQKPIIFWIFGLILGLFIGPIQSASRSMLAQIVPQDKISEMFGIYALTGKLSTFIGPFFISLITYFLQSKIAGLYVVLLMLGLGLVFMMRYFHYHFKKIFFDFFSIKRFFQ